MQLFEKLKGRILKSIIPWSEMGQQTAQAKEVFYFVKIFKCYMYNEVFFSVAKSQ